MTLIKSISGIRGTLENIPGDSLSDIDEIVVIGHSINEIDLPYFVEIAKNSPNANWAVCYYHQTEQDHFLEQLGKCSVHSKQIRTLTYSELQKEHIL